MGVSTHTMSRIYKGQKKGRSREEESLVWEDWDYSGLIKTYGHPNAGLCRYSYSAVQRDEDTVGHALCNGKVGYPPGIFASSPITQHASLIYVVATVVEFYVAWQLPELLINALDDYYYKRNLIK